AAEHRRARARPQERARPPAPRPHHPRQLAGARRARALLGQLPLRTPHVHAPALLEPAARAPSPQSQGRRPAHAHRARRLHEGAGPRIEQGTGGGRLAVITDRRAFIVETTRLQAPPHAPELKLHLADEITPIWRLTEEALEELGLPPPFWAFAWAGGQAL